MPERDTLKQKTASHESIFQRNIQKAAEKGFIKVVSREELIRALEKSRDTIWQGGKDY